ncbi:MAG: hypothetical protein MPJ50_12205 [Pirellulales bacterium]|nr:hypothetical protein [Pirellulales bacterium]
MQISTLISFLFGNRQAILTAANARGTFWLGLLFVTSAGFAREYDAEDLTREPWYVLLPLFASLGTSLLLFLLLCLAYSPLRPPNEPPVVPFWTRSSIPFRRRYGAFLGMYWLTAPMAWLYAIPVERFLTPVQAVGVNLSLLGIVSLWRVLLMTRIVSVIFSRSIVASFFVVMFFADNVVLFLGGCAPVPLLNVMGGIRLTESETLMASVTFGVVMLALFTWPLWLVGAFIASLRMYRGTRCSWEEVLTTEHASSITQPLWVLAAAAFLIWAAILPFTQGEQRNRWYVEDELQFGNFKTAITYMSRRKRGDFPPHWDPPPHLSYGAHEPPLIHVFLYSATQPDVAPWVQDIFRQKLELQADANARVYYQNAIQLNTLDDKQLEQYVLLLEANSYGRQMATYHKYEINITLDGLQFNGELIELSMERRSLLQRILDIVPAQEEPVAGPGLDF